MNNIIQFPQKIADVIPLPSWQGKKLIRVKRISLKDKEKLERAGYTVLITTELK